MEFRGDNLLDTFAKVFDRPITLVRGPYDRFGNKKSSYSKPGSYGKPGSSNPKYGGTVSSRSKYPKGSNSGKYGSGRYGPKQGGTRQISDTADEHNVDPRHLDSLRESAIIRAKGFLRSADYRVNRPEEGYAELYLLDTQEVIKLPGNQAGRAVRNGVGELKFEYNFGQYRQHPFFVLVFGHSHPKKHNSSRAREHRYLCYPSTPQPGDPQSDEDLKEFAPVVIGCPMTSPRVYKNSGGYNQFNPR